MVLDVTPFDQVGRQVRHINHLSAKLRDNSNLTISSTYCADDARRAVQIERKRIPSRSFVASSHTTHLPAQDGPNQCRRVCSDVASLDRVVRPCH